MTGTRNELPFVHVMPRVHDDIRDCLDFIDRQPRGDSRARLRDIDAAIEAIVRWPALGSPGIRRPALGRELRRRRAAQFSIIYAYFPADSRFPRGCVSLRAIRHRRVRNVFHGVKEQSATGYAR